jgi:hypothetical protein
MASSCPKCSRNIPSDSVYCPYCGFGIKPSARSTQVSAGGALMIVAAVTSFVFLILCVRALIMLHSWYPPGVASGWVVYNQALAGFSLMESLFGFVSGLLALTRRNYRLTMICAGLCTFSSAGAWTVSLVIPFASMLYSFLYYFLPSFAMALVGTVLIYPRRAEFEHP